MPSPPLSFSPRCLPFPREPIHWQRQEGNAGEKNHRDSGLAKDQETQSHNLFIKPRQQMPRCPECRLSFLGAPRMPSFTSSRLACLACTKMACLPLLRCNRPCQSSPPPFHVWSCNARYPHTPSCAVFRLTSFFEHSLPFLSRHPTRYSKPSNSIFCRHLRKHFEQAQEVVNSEEVTMRRVHSPTSAPICEWEEGLLYSCTPTPQNS